MKRLLAKDGSSTRSPLRSWENALERPTSLLVIPLFAFLNTGIGLANAAAGLMGFVWLVVSVTSKK